MSTPNLGYSQQGRLRTTANYATPRRLNPWGGGV
jgi:hypothetical protein